MLILGLIGSVACTEKDSDAGPSHGADRAPGTTPSSGSRPVVPEMPVTEMESWAALFQKEPASFPQPLADLNFQSVEGDITKISTDLLKTRRRTKGPSGWMQDQFPSVHLSARISASTRTLRFVRVDFKGRARPTLTALWGAPIEGQLEGGIPAWFWFDEARSVQAILQENESGDASLQYWPFIRLETLLQAPSTQAKALRAEHLASLIGRSQAEVGALYPDKVIHTGRDSFHGSLRPIRKEKRYFKVRFGANQGIIDSAEIKLQASVNPNLKGRIVELIESTWGPAQTSQSEPSFQWEKGGVGLALYAPPAFDPTAPPPKRKPFLRLLFTQLKAKAPASPNP